MNKRVFGRKLGRSRPAREALFASLIGSLVTQDKIVTTKAKAKAIRGQVEKYIHLAQKGTLSARRRVLADLDNNKKAVKALFVKKFKGIRIINLPPRKGDNAPLSRIELIKEEVKDENISTKTKRN